MNAGKLSKNQYIPKNRRRLRPGRESRKRESREKIYQYMLDQPVLYWIEVACMETHKRLLITGLINISNTRSNLLIYEVGCACIHTYNFCRSCEVGIIETRLYGP